MIDFDDGYGTRISFQQPIRCVATFARSGYTQNKEEYLQSELTYPNYFNRFDEPQYFKIGQNIYFQFSTKHTVTSIVLYNIDLGTNTNITASNAAIGTVSDATYGDITHYLLTIDTSSLGGNYYFIITLTTALATTQAYKTETFYISDIDSEDGNYIQFKNGTTTKNRTGVYYDGNYEFGFWLKGKIHDNIPTITKTISESFGGDEEIHKSISKRKTLLEWGQDNWYVNQVVCDASGHDYFKINGKRYIAVGDFTSENQKNGNMSQSLYNGSMEVALKKQSYVDLVEQTPGVSKNILTGEDTTEFVSFDGTNAVVYED